MLAPVGQFRLLPALDGGPLVLDRMTSLLHTRPNRESGS
jgi:hypothetical protein